MPHSPLLLQLVLILGTAGLLGLVLRRLGQPPVIGVMTAGIVLVPMAFGLGAAALLYGRFAPEGIAFPTLALFMASAMSISAIPIMAAS
jgi:Kef-type K+ transport system membrane component KefB